MHKLIRTPEDPPEIKTNITSQDLKSNYKNWAKKTSILPEGQYLSLYKTWLQVPEEKADNYNGITSDDFFGVIKTVMKMCMQHNIPLPR
eukprot:14200489-Ditylum_brightwellii.AAC.2